ncbi:alpha-amylase [Candidatus Micrarchaeota archaeon]|nr:alpha-amylase [Candidatus Micrarchaeota archaeon]
MPSVFLYFHVHQPFRLGRFSIFHEHNENLRKQYFDRKLNEGYFKKAAEKCYLPTNKILLNNIRETKGKFKVSFSITGTFLEQCEQFEGGEEVLKSFKHLASTGCVEFLNETYYHSLASLYGNRREFWEQVEQHSEKIKEVFGAKPKVFRNTEVIYNNTIAREAEENEYAGILTEGIEHVLGWRSPNYVYRPKGCERIKVVLRNYKLSDDVGYRFSAKWWSEFPLTADKYVSWLKACNGQTINLFMDYETFGEHHWEGSGIFQFLEHFPKEAIKNGLDFLTASETVERYDAVGEIDIPFNLSWADLERDVSAWLGNQLQWTCFKELEGMEDKVKNTKNSELRELWRLLQTSDHLYYLCTKSWADGDVHKHFSPHKDWGPYENFINYMNAIQDLKEEVEKASKEGLERELVWKPQQETETGLR